MVAGPDPDLWLQTARDVPGSWPECSSWLREQAGADSTIALPENLQCHAWRDLLSGRELTAHGGCLSAQAIFGELPAAVLIRH